MTDEREQERRALARDIVRELREQEAPFFIGREDHHRHHVFVEERWQDEDAERERRRYVDQKMKDDDNRSKSMREIKTKVIGGLALSGFLSLLGWLGYVVRQAFERGGP